MVLVLNVFNLGPQGSFRKVVFENANMIQKLFLVLGIIERSFQDGGLLLFESQSQQFAV